MLKRLVARLAEGLSKGELAAMEPIQKFPRYELESVMILQEFVSEYLRNNHPTIDLSDDNFGCGLDCVMVCGSATLACFPKDTEIIGADLAHDVDLCASTGETVRTGSLIVFVAGLETIIAKSEANKRETLNRGSK